jgi:hypothetical protein
MINLMETEKCDIAIYGLNCAKCPDYHTIRCEIECVTICLSNFKTLYLE